MICITPEQYEDTFIDQDSGPSELRSAREIDKVYGPGAYLSYAKWCEETERMDFDEVLGGSGS